MSLFDDELEDAAKRLLSPAMLEGWRNDRIEQARIVIQDAGKLAAMEYLAKTGKPALLVAECEKIVTEYAKRSAARTAKEGKGGITPNPEKKESLTDARIAAIVDIAIQFGYSPLSIPEGGRAAIQRYCLEKLLGSPYRFTAHSFKRAWQAARDAKKIDVQNLEKYLPK